MSWWSYGTQRLEYLLYTEDIVENQARFPGAFQVEKGADQWFSPSIDMESPFR